MISIGLRSDIFSFMRLIVVFIASMTAVFYLSMSPAKSSTEFSQWVKSIWPVAKSRGVSRKTFDQAFEGVFPDETVLAAAEHQPEFVKPVWAYLDQVLTDKRIAEGKRLLQAHQSTLAELEARFGVDRHILVAIWGVESAYGTHMGELNVIRSLATLAYRGERRRFGLQQLLGALKILQRGDIPIDQFKGSWAGAMGQTQFIPTTYNAYAIDADGDGRRNIWGSVPDALGSAANYLRVSKWKKKEPIVIEVKLPQKFDFHSAGLANVHTMSHWIRMGVVDAVDGGRLRSSNRRGSVILPSGANGPAFIVFKNFRSILRYNNAVAYALAVSYLAKRFKGKGQLVAKWPVENPPLRPMENKELQQLLADRGHKVGKVDGKVGSNTIKAIKAYQTSKGLKADGYPSSVLLNLLRKG